MDPEYIQLCIDEMNAIADASQQLVSEHLADGWNWDEERLNRRRAELYKEYLDAAGIEIRRK